MLRPFCGFCDVDRVEHGAAGILDGHLLARPALENVVVLVLEAGARTLAGVALDAGEPEQLRRHRPVRDTSAAARSRSRCPAGGGG